MFDVTCNLLDLKDSVWYDVKRLGLSHGKTEKRAKAGF